MKPILLSPLILILLLGSACTKKQVKAVLGDMCRDTYEKKAREQHIENLENPAYEDPPTYDQYQRQR